MEFEKRFNTEEACREYLFILRWPNGFQCPRCNHDKAWPLKNNLYQCAQGSLIQTDGWKGYNSLESIGYTHKIVRPSTDIGEDLLPNCHKVASLLKRWLLGTHQGAVSQEHLDYYLDEYTFRFNRRTSPYLGKLFYRLLQNAVKIEPTTFDQIKKSVRGRLKHDYYI